jgi:hypothetical protein
MNWLIRRPAVPASCKGLDLVVIEQALVDVRLNVTAAARALSIPSVDLRELVWSTLSGCGVCFGAERGWAAPRLGERRGVA